MLYEPELYSSDILMIPSDSFWSLGTLAPQKELVWRVWLHTRSVFWQRESESCGRVSVCRRLFVYCAEAYCRLLQREGGMAEREQAIASVHWNYQRSRCVIKGRSMQRESWRERHKMNRSRREEFSLLGVVQRCEIGARSWLIIAAEVKANFYPVLLPTKEEQIRNRERETSGNLVILTCY